MEFFQFINQFHSTIKFTAEWSRESTTFLDTSKPTARMHKNRFIQQTNRHSPVVPPKKLSPGSPVKETFLIARHSGYVEFAHSLRITNKEQENYVAIWLTGDTMDTGCKSKLIELNI